MKSGYQAAASLVSDNTIAEDVRHLHICHMNLLIILPFILILRLE